jgi:hypothetical protein
MRKITFLLSFLFCASICSAQTGKVFPDMQVTGLDGKTAKLPAAAKGKYTVIAMAASIESQRSLERWMFPLYATFIAPPKANYIPDDNYDVYLYFVTLLQPTGMGIEKAKEMYFNKMEKEYKGYVFLYEEKAKPVMDFLTIKNSKDPYFFVLDDTGKIVNIQSGLYTDAKLEAIRDVLDASEE